jgi:hypothetical protein
MRVNRIDDGERQEFLKRELKDIQRDAEFIDLEKEQYLNLPTSEEMRWNMTGRQLFRRKVDELGR